MAGVADKPWNPLDNPKDYIVLAGQKSPGLCDVVGAAAIRNIDERQGYGLSGAFVVFKGRGLAKFSVRFRLYDAADWLAWNAFSPLVDKVPTRRTGKGKDSGVMTIVHPLLAECAVDHCMVTERGQPEQTGDGEWTIEIKFIEWRQPKLSLATPEGAVPDEPDPIEAVIGKLTEQRDRLATQTPPHGPPPLPGAP